MVAYRGLQIRSLTFSFERSKLKSQEASKNKRLYYYDSELSILLLHCENELATSSSELQRCERKKGRRRKKSFAQYFVSDTGVEFKRGKENPSVLAP